MIAEQKLKLKLEFCENWKDALTYGLLENIVDLSNALEKVDSNNTIFGLLSSSAFQYEQWYAPVDQR